MNFQPHLEILPPPQQWLWPRLTAIASGFALYGGTAVALRHGHRFSVDFDFFGDIGFDALEFYHAQPLLKNSEIIQRAPNTLTVTAATPSGPVKLSFFGGLSFGRAGTPDLCADNGVQIASPLDLAVQKLNVIQIRSEAKDYVDLDCLLSHGVGLAEALGAAETIYPGFPVMWALKAMCYHQDGNVASVPEPAKRRLIQAASRFQGMVTVAKISERLTR